MKKLRIKGEEDEGEDRISKLPDEIIHKIMHCLDSTRLAVQTSILSNRWKLIWTTLPFLKFDLYENYTSESDELKEPEERKKFYSKFSKFVYHVFSHRDHRSNILKLELKVYTAIPKTFLIGCVKYAISHNVEDLCVCSDYDLELSIFRSNSLKVLNLALNFVSNIFTETNRWDLPALTTLKLRKAFTICIWWFLESYLMCLPALKDLLLDNFVVPNSLSLPSLRDLHLVNCCLSRKPWNLPALLSLELDNVIFSLNMTEFFSVLVSLQNLTLKFALDSVKDCLISCHQLLNLKIRTIISTTRSPIANILVVAPKLRNFDCTGIVSITCGVPSLENVNIKLRGCFKDKTKISLKQLKRYYRQLTIMFPGLGSAKILTLDLETVEALSEVSDLLGHLPSPFYNLMYVKLPQEYKESSLSSTCKSYLLGGSSGATIVTTLPQNDMLTRMEPWNMVFEEPLATATKELVDSQDVPKKVCVDSNYGLWQGYEVNSEFVGLLDLIMKKYPETFENLTRKSSKLSTMKLNMLCTSVNDFRKTSMTKVSCEMIAEYRELFAELQRSFNLKWLVSRLNYIEQLHFPNPLLHELPAVDSFIDDTKSNLEDLQTWVDDAKNKLKILRTPPLEMRAATGHTSKIMGSILAASAGCIGDYLFSDT